jgi:hypothetical protein
VGAKSGRLCFFHLQKLDVGVLNFYVLMRVRTPTLRRAMRGKAGL